MSTSTAVGAVITYIIKQNTFGDSLPVIPSDSMVEFHSVLFRLDLEVELSVNGNAAAGVDIPFKVTGVHSCARLLQPTDCEGRSILRLETRYSGLNRITPLAPEYHHSEIGRDHR